MEKQNQNFREQIALLRIEINQKTQLISKLQQSVQDSQNQYQELLTQVVELQNQNEMLTDDLKEIPSLNSKIAQQAQRINELGITISSQKTCFEQDKNTLVLEIQALETQNQQQAQVFEKDLNEYEDKNSSLMKENCEIKDQNIQLQKEINELKDQIHNHAVSLNQMKLTNEELNTKIESLESKQTEKDKENLTLSQNLLTLSKELQKEQQISKELQTICKQAISLMHPNYSQGEDPSQLIRMLSNKLQKPSLNYASTQTKQAKRNLIKVSTETIVPSEIKPVKHKPMKKPESKKPKETYHAPNSFEQIENRFQTELSLEKIIQIHHKLLEEESQHSIHSRSKYSDRH